MAVESFLGRVEIPNGIYSGQKLMNEVRMKIPDSTSRMMAVVPERYPVAYNPIITIAIMTRRMRSNVPMFGFINLVLYVETKLDLCSAEVCYICYTTTNRTEITRPVCFIRP